MSNFTFLLVGAIIGFVVGIVVSESLNNDETAKKLSKVMSASILDCVTHKIITKEQVHDIETVFHKHIEYNFKHIKASHTSEEKK